MKQKLISDIVSLLRIKNNCSFTNKLEDKLNKLSINNLLGYKDGLIKNMKSLACDEQFFEKIKLEH